MMGIEKAIQHRSMHTFMDRHGSASRCIWEPMSKWAGIDEDK